MDGVRQPTARIEVGPRPLDPDRRWMVKMFGYMIEGAFSPVRVEVRMKPPCACDQEPPDQPDEIVWERRDCDCWPDPWPGAEHVPPGGMPIRLLRNLRVGDFAASWNEALSNAEKYDALDHPVEAVAEHLRAMVEATKQPKGRRGRAPGDGTVHLRRLAELDRGFRAGQTRNAIARRLKISTGTFQTALAWAHKQTPAVWTSLGPGRPGHLTDHGRVLVAAVEQQQQEGRSR